MATWDDADWQDGSEYWYERPENWYTVRHLFQGLNDGRMHPYKNRPEGGIIIDQNAVPSELEHIVATLGETRYYVDKVSNPISREVLSNCLRQLSTVTTGPQRNHFRHVRIEFGSTETGLDEFCSVAETYKTHLEFIYVRSNNAKVNLNGLYNLCCNCNNLHILDLHNVTLTAKGQYNLRKIVSEGDFLAIHLTNVVLSHEVDEKVAPDTIDLIRDISQSMNSGGGRVITYYNADGISHVLLLRGTLFKGIYRTHIAEMNRKIMIGQNKEQGWDEERLVQKLYSHFVLRSGFYYKDIAWSFRASDRCNKMTKQQFSGSTVAKSGWQTLQTLDEDQKASIDEVVLKDHFTQAAIEATLETAEISAVEQATRQQLTQGILSEDHEVIPVENQGAFISRAREIFDEIYSGDYSVDWEEYDETWDADAYA